MQDPIDNTFGVILLSLLIYKFISTKGKKRYEFILRYLILCIFIELGKNIVSKLRPDGSDHRSFPSGHSSNVWFIAASFDFNIFITLWAIAVMISRISLRRHDIFDVSAGAILGITIARINVQKIIDYLESKNVYKTLELS
jgi:membrane-associated phospholipid phosphatase